MAEKTKGVRTLMYSVEGGTVVVHKLPWNANEPYGRSKFNKLIARVFTFEDPRVKGDGQPQVIVTQTVDLDKPIDGGASIPDTQTEGGSNSLEVKMEEPPKKWLNMNAAERKAYQEAKRGKADG